MANEKRINQPDENSKMIMNTIISLCIASIFSACSENPEYRTIKIEEWNSGFIDATISHMKNIISDSIETGEYDIHLNEEEINDIIRDYANKLFTFNDSSIIRYKKFERSKIGDSIQIPEPLIKEYAWKTRIDILNQDNKTKELLEGEKTKKMEQQKNEIDSLKKILHEKELELEETTTNRQRIREGKEHNIRGIEATKKQIKPVARSNP